MAHPLSARLLCTGIICTVTSMAPAEVSKNIHMADELIQLRQQVTELRRSQEELQKIKGEVQRLREEGHDNWLNERRAEEVKTLIREVLSDADTRASLLSDGVMAGHDGKKFFLASEDGSFLLNIGAQMQFRFIANSRQNSGSDDLTSGFQLRRTKLNFAGHIGNPKIGYDIVLAAERTGGDVLLEDFIISYKLADGVKIKIGQMKLPFLREELLSSKRQLAVDRSSVTEYFTLDRGQGVQLAFSGDDLKAMFMISDGADSEGEDFNDDDTDIALTGRVEVLLAGNWKQAKDFVAWRGDDPAVFIGAAVHHEIGETGTTGGNNNFTAWTIDGLLKADGWTVMAAVNGMSTDNEAATNFDDLGILVQIAYMLTNQFQPYIRYEHLDIDGMDKIGLITAGANYYFKKHNAKLTVDVVYGLDPLVAAPARKINDPFSDGLGLLKDAAGEDGQVALRSQFQLLF